MGRWHGYYASRAGARIVTVVDRDRVAAETLARRFKDARGLGVTDPWQGVADAQVVHVCTPLESHFELASRALESGCHVLIEKPATSTAAQLEQLLEVARRRECRLAAVHQLPYQSGFGWLQDNLARLGELVATDYVAHTAGADGYPAGERRRVLLEILPHPLSLFHALGQENIDVSEWRVVEASDDDLTLVGGTTVSMRIHVACRPRPIRHQLRVAGTQGSALLDLYHGFGVFEPGTVGWWPKVRRPFGESVRLFAGAAVNLTRRALARQPAYPGLWELIASFYDSLGGSGTAERAPTTRDEVATLRAVAALIDRLRADGY